MICTWDCKKTRIKKVLQKMIDIVSSSWKVFQLITFPQLSPIKWALCVKTIRHCKGSYLIKNSPNNSIRYVLPVWLWWWNTSTKLGELLELAEWGESRTKIKNQVGWLQACFIFLFFLTQNIPERENRTHKICSFNFSQSNRRK